MLSDNLPQLITLRKDILDKKYYKKDKKIKKIKKIKIKKKKM